MTALPKLGSPVTRRLRVQSNGWIVLKTRQSRSVSTTGARDLIFNIQWFSTKGWVNHGEFVDDLMARQCFREQRERNRSIRWRLIARNEHGQVVLPRNWRGPIQ